MKTILLGRELKNPLVLASGILGNSYEILEEVYKKGCGLVTMKSIGPKERAGHKNPTVLDYGFGVINAVGLPTPGYKNMEDEWDKLDKRDFPVIASIYGSTVQEFRQVAKYVSSKEPDFIEINISCPNTKKEGMIFGVDKQSAFKVVKAVKNEIKQPLIAKLTPQAIDIGDIAHACEKAGADAICAINTVGPGMVIDIETGRPILDYKKGGVSGPGIKPISIRCIYDIFRSVYIPIIGLGGVRNGRDAIELMMAGASLVGVGSAVYYEGMSVFERINKEIDSWLKKKKLSLKDIVGVAHEDGSNR